MPGASNPESPPPAFPDWLTAVHAAVAQFGPVGWSLPREAYPARDWRPALDDVPLVEPAPGHITHLRRALPQQFHLAWVDIDWAEGTLRFSDNDQREGEDVELLRVTLPEAWILSLKSVRWP